MNELINAIEQFEFIRPTLLLALIPLLIFYTIKLKFGSQDNSWQSLLPSHLYQQLIVSKHLKSSKFKIHTFAFAYLLAIIAIAGPSWEKLPQAVYQTQAGKVIVMDMSMSMRATDLSPNRLTRARFKAIDLIKQVSEGETGLVAYAGDAFVISPLTDDANTLVSLIPSLRPEIMPQQGSNPIYALETASELLKNAGYQSGQIYWISDGIRISDIDEIRDFLNASQYDVSALLVGTEEGAPIEMQDGTLLKDRMGSIVIPKVDERYFSQALSGTGASYSIFTSDNSDILAIERELKFEQQQSKQVEDTQGDILKDMGPYILLLLLPIAAYSFRKGLLASVLVCVLYFPQADVYAQVTNDQSTTSTNANELDNAAKPQGSQISGTQTIKNWFLNRDQRGKQAFDSKQYDVATELFEDKQWQAASAYKSGNYEDALALFDGLSGIENRYNKANSLAKLGRLDEALVEYEYVLEQQPDHENALKNKALVESLLEQQQQDEKQSESQNKQEQNNESSQDKQNKQENSNQQEESQQEQSEENSKQDPSSNEGQNSEQDEASEQSEQSPNNEESSQDSSSLEQAAKDQTNNREKQNETENQRDEEEQDSSAKNAQAQQNNEQQAQSEEQTQAIAQSQVMENMTPEEKEEYQRMQMILNKIPDDPAYLLQRKMLLEAYKRKNAPVPPTQENW